MNKAHTPPKLSFALMSALVGFPLLSETIYTPSLPNIAQSLNTSAHLVEWTLSVYFIGFALGVGFWGILSDRFGRRPIMLLGILIYCIASFACWKSTSITMLLCFRVLQAIGASVGSVITQTMLRDVLTGKERSRWFSLIGIPLSLAPALGPLCGSWLDYLFDWHANFAVLLLMGLCLLVICFKKLPETRPATLIVPSQVHLLHLTWRMICDKKVMGCAALVAGINGILFSFYAEAPFMLMDVMGLHSNQYGWVGLAIALAGLIGSMISHRLLKYLSHESLIGMGCVLMIVGTMGILLLAYGGLLSAASLWLGLTLLLAMMFVAMLGGMGLAIPNLLSMALTEYHLVLGRAGSMFGLFYYALVASLTALMGELHDGTVFPMPWYFLGLSIVMLGIFFYTLLMPHLKSTNITP